MASQQPANQRSPVAAGRSGAAKISPRKFAEKIALLNKKEAEGNAEFEAIIKQVQVTKSQGPAARKQPLSDQDEIEEVYKNLMKCVSQFEEAEQQQQQQRPNYEAYAAQQPFRSTRSASTAAERLHQADSGQTFSGSNYLSIQSQQQAGLASGCSGGTCRTRVSSFGSANQKYFCLASGAAHQEQTTEGPTSRGSVYLDPANDFRSLPWQKSSSEPELHVLNSSSEQSALPLPVQPEPFNHVTSIGDEDQEEGRVELQQHLASNVPGIKICTIEDEDLIANEQHSMNAEPMTLPDLSSLQFNSLENTPLSLSNTSLNSNDSVHHIQIPSAQTNYGRRESNEALKLCSSSYSETGHCYWDANQPSNLAAPQLKLISNSDCGLTVDYNQQPQQQPPHQPPLTVPYNGHQSGIIRSRSHNSIDNLIKQQQHQPSMFRAHNNSNFQTNNHSNNKQLSSNQMGQYQCQPVQAPAFDSYRSGQQGSFQVGSYEDQPASLAAADGYCNGGYSHHQHQGSVSPMQDSPSNLNSPMSDQNSPSSLINEYPSTGTFPGIYNPPTQKPHNGAATSEDLSQTPDRIFHYEHQAYNGGLFDQQQQQLLYGQPPDPGPGLVRGGQASYSQPIGRETSPVRETYANL